MGIILPGNGPFYWEILQAIEDRLTREGYYTSVFYTRDVDANYHSSLHELSDFLRNNLIEGYIHFPLVTREDDLLMDQLRAGGDPLVIIDRDVHTPDVNQIIVDNYSAGSYMAEAFSDKHHRKPLFIDAFPTSYSASQRKSGFINGLATHGISCGEERIIRGDFTAGSAYAATREIWERLPPFTAVFAVNDASAIGFMRAAAERGMICPRDYEICGFDNNEEFTPFTTPSISTFHQPLQEIGEFAAERILCQLDGGSTPQQLILQPRFIQRESFRLADTVDT